MAETFRHSKIEKLIRSLEAELPDLQQSLNDADPHGMGLYYEGCLKTQKYIINKLKREFKIKEEEQK